MGLLGSRDPTLSALTILLAATASFFEEDVKPETAIEIGFIIFILYHGEDKILLRWRMIKKILLSLIVTVSLLPAVAQAEPKFFGLFWWPDHWRNQDFMPYFDNSKDPHNTQWDKTALSPVYWTPKEWVTMDGGRGLALIQKWYNVGILQDQYVDDDMPYLVVGPNFYHLSGSDKRRVMQTIDAVYQVTSLSPKMFYIEDSKTEKVIGYYTPKGLILQ